MALWGVGSAAAFPFTYQGRLVRDGVLASGNHELRFRLFDQASGGAQVGPTLTLPTVPVTNGVFTVSIDFGDSAFAGASRWLELGARTAGSGDALTVFDPRQAVLAVPYAMHAFTGPTDASLLTQGILPDARLADTIARTSQLTTLSNALTARIDQLQAQVDSLAASVLALQNGITPDVPTGFNLVSILPADPALLSQGFVQFFKAEAPGWRNGNAAGMPSARISHAAAWTGTDFAVWGGALGNGTVVNSGGLYDPVNDLWAPTSLIDPPAARRDHTMVWSGTAILVWGGFGGGFLKTGGSYDPGTGAWSPITTSGAPDERDSHVAVWTGARMLVWGGRNAVDLLADGASYDPTGPAWAALPTAGAPAARIGATAVWTGTRLIVWGGTGHLGLLDSGGALPVAGGTTPGAWAPVASLGAPSARSGHSAVWTGQRMLVWGGQSDSGKLSDGAAYDPGTDTWTAIPDTGAPTARSGHVATWTGTEMLVVGGETAGGAVADGAAYDPVAGMWRPLSNNGSPVARTGGRGAWSGTELILFGGQAAGTPVGALQRLNPQPDWYFYRKP